MKNKQQQLKKLKRFFQKYTPLIVAVLRLIAYFWEKLKKD